MRKGILLILDGYGEGKPYEFNAVTNAKTPTLDKIKKHGFSLLKTDGEAVGLFEGEMGGSEVGHTTIGAGRIVPSTAKKIRDDILSGEFAKNAKLNKVLNDVEKNNSDLHLIGLMSDKNIHSDINHAVEIINLAKGKAKNIFIHFITDGRDCGAYDSIKFLKYLKKSIKNIENCQILSVSGRFYAMDRENYLDRTNRALNAMFSPNGQIKETEIEKYLKSQHQKGNNDQYVEPISVVSNFDKLSKNDCLFFFNFREDRLRQICSECKKFGCKIATMSDVANVNSVVLYPNKIKKNTLSEYLSKQGLKQIKISESTKYAHVTYFLNGGEEKPFENEDRIHVQTIETDDYAKTPKMQAEEITKQTLKAMDKNYDAVIVNYSNADMLGHTGNYKATVKAIEFLDKCVKKIIQHAKKNDYFVLITADHGNSEEMVLNGEPQMAHTLNEVMISVVNENCKLKAKGGLQDVAPTYVELLGLKPSKHFEGKSLII